MKPSIPFPIPSIADQLFSAVDKFLSSPSSTEALVKVSTNLIPTALFKNSFT